MFESRESSRFSPDLADCCSADGVAVALAVVAPGLGRTAPAFARRAGARKLLTDTEDIRYRTLYADALLYRVPLDTMVRFLG